MTDEAPEIPAFEPDPSRPLGLLGACPAYSLSPLLTLEGGAGNPLLVKDESARMNLGAFKALGGVYAVARLVEEHWQEVTGSKRALRADQFMSDEVREVAGSLGFVCASAGNHGLAVAAGARLFGARARIHLSAEVPVSFAAKLEGQQAEVVRSGATYEDSMAAASEDAASSGAILLADGSWPGYTRAPSLVMEGYTVIAEELRHKFEANGQWPSHVYLQAGVGGLAGAVAHMIRHTWQEQPEIVVVEPDAAACLKQSQAAGRPVTVDGPVSNMGRLDCKSPSLIAFGIMQDVAPRFATVSDEQAQAAADWLGPHGLLTTPSGAAGLAAYMQSGQDDARALVIVSEGAV